MKLFSIALSLITAASIGVGASAPSASAAPLATPDLPAASWAQADSADTLWRRGRVAIAEEAWRDAAYVFERLVSRYPNSAYAGDALYWQAFALQRSGTSSDLRSAVRALERQKERYPRAQTIQTGEAGVLLTRLNGRLARGGDPDAARSIAELAEVAAQVGAQVAATVAPAVAEAAASVARDPEVQREINRAAAEAAREASEASREISRDARERAREARERDRDRNDNDIPRECEGVIHPEQVEALNALLQMNADNATPILRRVLERRDRCSEVLRRKAVFMVSQKRSEEAVDILVNVARTDPDRETREQAVFWLSQTRSPRVVEVLEQILVRDANTDPELQKKAIFSLAQTRDTRAGEILRDFVMRREASNEARADAIFWLGQSRGNGAFLRELFPRLDNDELRDKAIFSIAQQRDPENSRFLLGLAKDRRYTAELRKSALFWASQQGNASVADLGQIYDTSPDDSELRNQVIFSLSQRRDAAAIDKLVDIARKETDPELRKQAIFWLGQTRDPRVPQLLEDIINRRPDR